MTNLTVLVRDIKTQEPLQDQGHKVVIWPYSIDYKKDDSSISDGS
jgi:hypothetical protein